MANLEPRYKSTLNGQRSADADVIEKLRETTQKFTADHQIIESLLNDLSMSTDPQDKPTIPIVQILHQNLSRTEEIGVILKMQASMCKDMVNTIYIHINEVDRRLTDIENRYTSKYLWTKLKFIGEFARIIIAVSAAVVIVKGVGI